MTGEQRKEIKIRYFHVTYSCECGGELKWTGFTFACNPPLYSHSCTKCARVESFRKIYPCREEEVTDVA